MADRLDFRALFVFKSEIRQPQIPGVVAHDALDVLRKPVRRLRVDVERYHDCGAAHPLQFA
jgi:hypothetical protein